MKLKRTLWVALAAVVLAAVAGIGICFAYFLIPTEYCLLLFGPDGETRVWVEVRGQTVFLHRDSLKSPAERVRVVNEDDGDTRGIEILDHDGRTRYVLTSISPMPLGDTARRHVMAYVDVTGSLDYKQYCDVELRSNPNDVAVAHFAGPLTATWSEAFVAPSTIEIPVTEPDPESETAEKPAASNE